MSLAGSGPGDPHSPEGNSSSSSSKEQTLLVLTTFWSIWTWTPTEASIQGPHREPEQKGRVVALLQWSPT